MIESFVFAGAFVAYLGLTACALLALRGPVPGVLAILVGLVAAAHVVGVWSHRYGWDVAVATRNGYTGFIIFHLALLSILSASFLQPHKARVALGVAFILVAIGASGAVLRYPEVAIYRYPVWGAAALVAFFAARAVLFRKTKP